MIANIQEHVVTADVLVIGSGIAGCFAAANAKESGAESVVVVEQGVSGFHGRTSYGTNINRVVLPDDDHDQILKLTCLQTDYMIDQEFCVEAINESYDIFQEMIKMGADFERGWDGRVKWMMQDTEYKDMPSRQAIWAPFGSYKHVNHFKVYAEKQGAQFFDRTLISDLIVQDGRCIGAVGINVRTGDFFIFKAKAVCLCTADWHAAGCNYTNFTGDGMAMALRAGAGLRGMEFGRIGFGPIWPDYSQQKGGAAGRMQRTYRNMDEEQHTLINGAGEEFVEKYEYLRRVPGRLYGGPCWKNYIGAIVKENREGRGPVFWDNGAVKFEMGYNQKSSAQTGGVRIDKDCRTCVPGLFAGGNGSDMCCGMHFSTVYNLSGSAITGRRAGIGAYEYGLEQEFTEPDRAEIDRLKAFAYAPVMRDNGVTDADLRCKMIDIWPYVDYRTEKTLTYALNELKSLDEDAAALYAPGNDPHELAKCIKIRNVVTNAQAEAMAALERRESRIEHYRDDYPLVDNINWLKWITIKGVGDDMHTEIEDVPLERYKYKPERTMFDRLELRKEGV